MWGDTLRLSKNDPYPPFTEEELKQACKFIEYVDYEQPVEHGGAGMRFFDAGTKWFVNHGEDRAAETLAAGIERAGFGEGVAVDRGGGGWLFEGRVIETGFGGGEEELRRAQRKNQVD